jgi:hypothetical protein
MEVSEFVSSKGLSCGPQVQTISEIRQPSPEATTLFVTAPLKPLRALSRKACDSGLVRVMGRCISGCLMVPHHAVDFQVNPPAGSSLLTPF